MPLNSLQSRIPCDHCYFTSGIIKLIWTGSLLKILPPRHDFIQIHAHIYAKCFAGGQSVNLTQMVGTDTCKTQMRGAQASSMTGKANHYVMESSYFCMTV